jgi:hypothetical protein
VGKRIFALDGMLMVTDEKLFRMKEARQKGGRAKLKTG